MKRILHISFLFLSLVLCFVSLAWAGGLDDAQAGLAAQNRGDYDEAIRLFTKAIESGDLSQETLISVYNSRANTWDAKRDYDHAIADYSKAIELSPKNAIAKLTYYGRGYAWRKKGDYDRAIADYTKAIELDPNFTYAYGSRGYAWRKKGGYDRAIADYTKVIELDPKDADTYNNLAWLLAVCPESKYRDGEKAIELAKKAIELKETTVHIDTLAAAYAEAGRFQDAIQTEEGAIAKLKQEGNTKGIAEFEQHLASYKAGKPWREK
jgi:Flp pilus assembly protein TadD